MDQNFLIKAIKLGIFAALLVPLVRDLDYYFPFVGPKGLYFMAVAEIVFFLWLILIWRWKQYRPDFKNPLLLLIIVFVGISFISAIFGMNFSVSFWSKFERMSGVLMFLHLTAFAVVVSSLFNGRDWKRLFYASIGIAVFIGVDAMFDVSGISRGGGYIGNDSFLGTYLLFNAFIALYLSIVSESGNREEVLRETEVEYPKKISQNKFYSREFLWEDIFFTSRKWRQYVWPRIFSMFCFAVISFCLVFEGTQFWGYFLLDIPYAYPGGILDDVAGSGARAAKISLFAGIILLGVLRLAVHKNKIVKSLTIGFVGLAAVVLVSLAIFLFQKGSISEFLADGAIRSRTVVWEIAWNGFLERPWLGWGPENFGLAFARHYNPCLGSAGCGIDIWYDRAHNVFLDTLVETGIFGLISYLAVFFGAIFLLWRSYFLKIADFAAAGTFTALLAAYFLQNQTVFDMVASYVMFFICMAFIASLYKPQPADEKIWPLPLEPRHIILPLAAAVSCFYFFVICPMAADRNTSAASMEKFGSAKRLQIYRIALESSPMGKYQIRLFFAHQWLVALGNENISARVTSQQSQETYAFLAGELEKSCRESPLDYQSYLELGRIYNGWSILDKSKQSLAENTLKKAIEISPNNQQAYWELAQAYTYQLRINDAETVGKQAYDLYPGNERSKKVIEEIARVKDLLSKTKN